MHSWIVPVVICAPLLGAEEVEFRFAPPDGTSYTATTTNLRSMNNGSAKMDDNTETMEKVTIHKTAAGYTITRTVDTKNGDQLETALNGVAITWTVDSNGHITNVQGYEKTLDELKAKLPPTVTPELMANKDQSEWESRVGRFAGKKVKVGESWTDPTEVAGPGGASIPTKTTTTVTGLADCPAGKCAQVHVAIRTAADAPVDIDSNADLLVDPATGLFYGETLKRTARLERDGQKVIVTESHETKYAYAKP